MVARVPLDLVLVRVVLEELVLEDIFHLLE
jgi:hypothetical protein